MKFVKLRALTAVTCLLLLSTPLRAEDELVSLDDEPTSQTADKAMPADANSPVVTPGAESADGELTEIGGDAAAAGGGDLESLDGSTAVSGGDEEVALDLGAGQEDFFNPYVFSRDPIWIILPVFGLIILGLHLLPVPKRQVKKKIDQAQKFFRGLSGESTGMINVKELRESTRTSIQRPKKETK